MKLLVLDTIGAGLLGAGMPWSVRMRQTVQTWKHPGDASIWGTQLRFQADCRARQWHRGARLRDRPTWCGRHNGSVT